MAFKGSLCKMQVASTVGASWSGHEALLLSSCSRYLGLKSCISLARSCRVMAAATIPISDTHLGGLGPATGAAALRSSTLWMPLRMKRRSCSRMSARTVSERTDGLLSAPAVDPGAPPSSVGSFLEQLRTGGSVPPAPVCNHFLRGDLGLGCQPVINCLTSRPAAI